MECRVGCAACCVSISITSPVPGFPDGKPAGERCAALSDDGVCRIWGRPDYPSVCRNFRAGKEYCGENRDEAEIRLAALEAATAN